MKKNSTKLTASEGLLISWCLTQKVNIRAVKTRGSTQNHRYETDLEKLLDWLKYRNMGNVATRSYAAYKADILKTIRNELKHTARLSHVNSLDILGVVQRNNEWIRLVEIFGLVTEVQATDIVNWSGTSTRYPPPKQHLPRSRRPVWLKNKTT